MKFFYHIVNMEDTHGQSERVEMEFVPFPATLMSPPRVGETMTVGTISDEGVVLLKVISVHWEVLSHPQDCRCLVTVVDENDSAQGGMDELEELIKANQPNISKA